MPSISTRINKQMRLLITICSIINLSLLFTLKAQPEIRTGQRYVKFECWNIFDSILVPSDCTGVEYSPTEEGPIIDFKFKYGGCISIICAGNSYLSVGMNFVAQDTVMVGGKIRSIRYYDKSLNMYAREDESLGYGMQYYVPAWRKEEFDKVFDAICLKAIRQKEIKSVEPK